MDPNVTLANIRSMVRAIDSLPGNAAAEVVRYMADRLAEDITALDEWFTMGGFKPAAWPF
jgi:hypothetical protein